MKCSLARLAPVVTALLVPLLPVAPAPLAHAAGPAAPSTPPVVAVPASVVLTGWVDTSRISHDHYTRMQTTIYRREADGTLTSLGHGDEDYFTPRYSVSDAMPGYDYTAMVRDLEHPERGEWWLGGARTSVDATFVRPETSLPTDLGTIAPYAGTRWLTGRCLDASGVSIETCGSFDLWRHDADGWRIVQQGGVVATDGAAPEPIPGLDEPYGMLRVEPGATYTVSYQQRSPDGTPDGAPYFLGDVRTIEQARTFMPAQGVGGFDIGDFTYAEIAPVRATGTVVGPGDEPARRITVRTTGATLDSATTAADGTFEVRGYPGQQVRLVAQGSPEGLSTSAARTITLTDEVQSLEAIRLDRVPGFVSGTILGSDGEPAFAGLDLYEWSPETGDFELHPDSAYGIGASDRTTGRWRISGLEPGLYTISARPVRYQSDDLGATLAGGFRITGDARATVVPDLSLRRGVVLTGTVTGADGLPRGGVDVGAYSFNGPGESYRSIFHQSYSAQTDADGHYRIVTFPGAELNVTANEGSPRFGQGHDFWRLGGGIAEPTRQTDANSIDVGEGATLDIRLSRVVLRVALGTTLRAVPGVRPATAAPVAYQWFRDGVAVAGATRPTIATDEGDLGHRYWVVVSSPDATSVTSPSVVMVPTSSTTGAPRRVAVRRGARAVLPVRVATPAGLTASGWVQAREGRTVLTARRLTDARAHLRLPVLKPGRHRVVLAYRGSAKVERSIRVVWVVVRRR